MIEIIPIEKIHPAPDNPRRDVGDVTELAASITAVGIIEPLIVTKDNGSFMVVAGARRLAAAKVAGLADVPAIVREVDDRQRAEIMLIENLQREDLNPLEEAHAFQRLTTELGFSQRDLATRIGRSQSHISKRLALLELPEKAREALDAGGITVAGALELTRLEDAAEAERVLDGYSHDHLGDEEGPLDVGDLRWEVENRLREREVEQKFADLVVEAETGKHRYVPAAKDRYGEAGIPKGALLVDPKALEWQDAVRLPVKQHAKEECHAVTVIGGGHRGAQLVHICTDPKRHPGAKKAQPKETPAQRKFKEHKAALVEARARRHEFIGRILEGRLSKGDVLEAVVPALIGEVWASKAKIACSLLGLEVEPRKQEYGPPTLDAVATLTEHAAKGERQLLQVGLALALAVGEENFGGYDVDSSDHFKLLRRHGYRTTEAERTELSGKAPR